MSRRLRRVAAILFVVAAALFVVGVATEGDSHTETTEAVHDESGETAEHNETAEAAGHDEAAEAESGEHAEEEAVLGIDVESPGAVASAVAVSLALAVGLWLLNRRWLALVAVGFGLMFAVFDIAEISHQLDESRTGLAVLAGVIAAVHLGAAAAGGLSTRPERAS